MCGGGKKKTIKNYHCVSKISHLKKNANKLLLDLIFWTFCHNLQL